MRIEELTKEVLDLSTSGSEGGRIVGGGLSHGSAVGSLIGDGANLTLIIVDGDGVPRIELTVSEENVGAGELEGTIVGGGPGSVGRHSLDAEDVLAEVDILEGHITEEDRRLRVSDLEETELSALLEIPRAINVTELVVADGREEGFVGEGGASGRVAIHLIVGITPSDDGIRSGSQNRASLVQLISRRILPLSSSRQELSDRPLEHELILLLEGLAGVEVGRQLSTALSSQVERSNRFDSTLSSFDARRRSNIAKVLEELGELLFRDDRSRRRHRTNHEVRILRTEPSRQATRVRATKNDPGASVSLLHRFDENSGIGHSLLRAQVTHVVGRHILDRVGLTIVAVLESDVASVIVLGPRERRNLLEIEELNGSFTSKED